jgi:hypothetical protein
MLYGVFVPVLFIVSKIWKAMPCFYLSIIECNVGDMILYGVSCGVRDKIKE